MADPVLANRGTATISNTDTSAAVTHGLKTAGGAGATPAYISIIPESNTHFYVDSIGATTMTINVPIAPGAGSSFTFIWYASQ